MIYILTYVMYVLFRNKIDQSATEHCQSMIPRRETNLKKLQKYVSIE